MRRGAWPPPPPRRDDAGRASTPHARRGGRGDRRPAAPLGVPGADPLLPPFRRVRVAARWGRRRGRPWPVPPRPARARWDRPRHRLGSDPVPPARATGGSGVPADGVRGPRRTPVGRRRPPGPVGVLGVDGHRGSPAGGTGRGFGAVAVGRGAARGGGTAPPGQPGFLAVAGRSGRDPVGGPVGRRGPARGRGRGLLARAGRVPDRRGGDLPDGQGPGLGRRGHRFPAGRPAAGGDGRADGRLD